MHCWSQWSWYVLHCEHLGLRRRVAVVSSSNFDCAIVSVGKSTLLKLLTGEVNPTKGEVRRNPRLR